MSSLNNNVLAVFAVLLIAISVTGQVLIFTKSKEQPPMRAVTGQVSGTGTVRLTIKYSISTINFSARLADDNASVILEWSDYGADNYTIYQTTNLSGGFDYGAPLIAGLTELNYTDANASQYLQRFYQLGVYDNNTEFILDTSVGKFDILLMHSTLTPPDVEMNSVSFPLLPTNASVQNVLRNGDDWDVISTYNTSLPLPKYDSIQKFPGFGWQGDYTNLTPGRGYDFTIVGNTYNLTIAGTVPTGIFTVELKKCSLTVGDIEMNSVGWNSAYRQCDLDAVLSNESHDWDVISTYDATDPIPKLISIQKFPGFGWQGDFECLEPGKGYTFTVVGTGYNWSYDTGP